MSSSHNRSRRAGLAAFVGTTIEWYDFYVYATAAALVFGPLFFPSDNAVAETAAAFATFAIAFVVRPVGAILFGHIGDRLGRRRSLVLTLLLMGVSTVLVGVLPTHAQVGIWAPIMLIALRAMQGLAVGGEWGGAVLMSVEHAPAKSKTFYGGFTQLGNPAGALLASGIFALMSRLGDDFILNGGWRIPFLLSIVLIAVGFWVRYRVEESPVFEAEVQGKQQELPLRSALRSNRLAIVLGIGILPISTGGYYLATTFATSYATGETIRMSERVILDAMTVASLVEFLVTLPVAWLGDKWGRKNVMYIGLAASVLTFAPFLLILPGHVEPLVFLLASLVRVALSATYAPLAAIMSQLFPPGARYTSVALTYGLGAAIWAGFSPWFATMLLGWTGSIWSVIAMFTVMAAIATVCTYFAPQYVDAEPDSAPDGTVSERTAA
ncbi:Major facilitator superfamily MFS_1 OS=Tsukamurella paurometabola (strain ATCC 8368 / DSM /CCUG 35730 / CIP 100753 / JCM 10117 / KCTC 9821 / NBRC 16120/ NCIMB 702349 / NCTC 13040) OX=521096 GN=Tpau_4036 PE=4 SV=1 [Tsukamurella paurometabola]|uniref:Putative proline/betaine transporter n=1 Tax=Tsukamurella paurometabola (strain ATCC 8368 / DSM 20162 / CCUG 35730 / CIP 100753 / JCM 10117 / KCTC 9821 / NBRC 16120 / NCIMB 702349 / NCTC 13040) TaxID=521096 RepID=D5UNB2_TSUPD|nr:MFS transporter [Tsukamurella paurometabola]ADG80607.1 major facilitator superfamily MFS_1 [Tsukamurella paurometabola DSM 20162]SUP40263.1 Inner membrane metabolite transport protein yhjE [Tsukamurella paurometabola]